MKLQYPIPTPALKVWKELSDFGGIAHWSPDLAMSTQIARRGIAPGAVRELTFAKEQSGILTIRERIVTCGDGWFAYVIDGGFGPYQEAGSRWTVAGDSKSAIVTVESYVRGGPWWATLLKPIVYWQLKRGLKRALVGLTERLAKHH